MENKIYVSTFLPINSQQSTLNVWDFSEEKKEIPL